MTRRNSSLYLWTLGILTGVSLLAAAQAAPTLIGKQLRTLRGPKTGSAGFIPANYPNSQPQDWLDLFTVKLQEAGSLVGVYEPWDNNLVNGIPQTIHTAFGLSGVTPLVGIGFEPDALTQAQADAYMQQNGAAFQAVALAIAQQYHPKYLALGVEINRYYEKSPTGFNDFVIWYQQTYPLIKQISPATTVLTIFQLDYMKGGGFLSGTVHQPHWNIILQFGNTLDAVGFTVYPFLDSPTPQQIPANYFTEILQYVPTTPLLFTEPGWPSEPIATVPGSEPAQVDFLNRLLAQTKTMDLRALVWNLPHDLLPSGQVGGLFDHIALRRNDGMPKSVLADWKRIE